MPRKLPLLKPGDEVTVEVEALGPEGLGRATVGGHRQAELWIEDALAGEAGVVTVHHGGQRRAIGRLTGRTASAAERRTPPCPRWTAASPCRLMHLTAPARARHLEAVVREALAPTVGPAQVRPLVTVSDELGWRGRVTFTACWRDGDVVLGAYRRGSHRVQPMTRCPLHDGSVAAVARGLAPALRPLGPGGVAEGPVVSDGHCGDPTPWVNRGAASTAAPDPGQLVHVLLRQAHPGDGAPVQVVLVSSDGTLPRATEVADRIRSELPTVESVVLASTGPGDVVLGRDPPSVLAGPSALTIAADGLAFAVPAGAFFQVNLEAADRLQRDVVSWLAEGARPGAPALDVFCGVGAISLRLARQGLTTLGVEVVAAAAEGAEENARNNGLEASFVAGDAGRVLGELVDGGRRFDAIALNPPRRGCDPVVLEAVAALATRRLVYVSCSPTSLGRDLSRLVALGLDVVDVTPHDLFPASEHVETVVRLRAPGVSD